jgi:hypothetical protein
LKGSINNNIMDESKIIVIFSVPINTNSLITYTTFLTVIV